MIFHLGFELPRKVKKELNAASSALTEHESNILRDQIKKNSLAIEEYVLRLDLFLNREKHPPKQKHIHGIRERVQILMEENDTFRKVLWKNIQAEELSALPHPDEMNF